MIKRIIILFFYLMIASRGMAVESNSQTNNTFLEPPPFDSVRISYKYVQKWKEEGNAAINSIDGQKVVTFDILGNRRKDEGESIHQLAVGDNTIKELKIFKNGKDYIADPSLYYATVFEMPEEFEVWQTAPIRESDEYSYEKFLDKN